MKNKPHVTEKIFDQIYYLASQSANPYNDGWTAKSCKKDLYRIKCLIDDLYSDLPTFVGEDEWEQERLIELLKRK
jgi:hypothetical protein